MDIISAILEKVDASNLRDILFYLSSDPLPCRTLNYTRLGSDKCTLYEADDFIIKHLMQWGYALKTETAPVQSLQPDPSVPHGFRKPVQSEPWFDAVDIYGKKCGKIHPEETIVLIAHKDSQSWLPCAPGAHDNAVGVSALLEMARVLHDYEMQRSVIFLFPNEEHWPWTSVFAAQQIANANHHIIAVINVDGIGGKSEMEKANGRMTNVTRYSTLEGKKLADMMTKLNEGYRINLKQSLYFSPDPNDDDGSFINAGFPNSVLNIGSFPYEEIHYHTVGDKPEYVDLINFKKATQLCLAALVFLDLHGFPV